MVLRRWIRRRAATADPASPGGIADSRGRSGERAAADYLRRHGYRVEARNLRTRDAEIDLLVRRRRLWVAVEVKARSLDPAPERAVTPAQLERLGRALTALAPQLRPRPRELRVDVIGVVLDRSGAVGPAQEPVHCAGQTFVPRDMPH